jgi:hypothetical protein
MEVFDSFVRVIYDPDGAALVLVDYGDAMWGPVRIDGEQLVQVQSFVRALGVKAIARGNESHTLAFEKCREEDAMDDAFAARLNGIIALPRTSKDVLLSLEDGRQWRIANAAIGSWPGGQEERLTREGVEIIGGRLTVDEGVYVPGQTWGEISMEWENLGY